MCVCACVRACVRACVCVCNGHTHPKSQCLSSLYSSSVLSVSFNCRIVPLKRGFTPNIYMFRIVPLKLASVSTGCVFEYTGTKIHTFLAVSFLPSV